MKKRISLSLLLALCLTNTVQALESGDSLISRSYLENTYQQVLSKAMEVELHRVYLTLLQEQTAQLTALRNQYVKPTATTSGNLSPKEFSLGQSLVLESGSLIAPVQGVLAISQEGTVIDLTSGTELTKGLLQSGHQYLVAEDSKATVAVQSSSAQLGVQGLYTLSGDSALGHQFEDVYSTDWFYSGVLFVVNQGLFAGTDETHFSPSMTMGRGMMMTVLYRFAGAPQDQLAVASSWFYDVLDGDWYAPYVRWGATHNLTVGMGDGYFMPNNQVTRQQIMVMLRAFARDYLKQDVSHNGNLDGYVDVDLVGPWALDAVTWGVANGLFQGIPDGDTYLHGEAFATRGEVASMFMQFYLKYG